MTIKLALRLWKVLDAVTTCSIIQNYCPLAFLIFTYLSWRSTEYRLMLPKSQYPTFQSIKTPLCTNQFPIFAKIILCHYVIITAICYGHKEAEITMENRPIANLKLFLSQKSFYQQLESWDLNCGEHFCPFCAAISLCVVTSQPSDRIMYMFCSFA